MGESDRWVDELMPDQPQWVRDLVDDELRKREARLTALEGDYSTVLKNLAWHVARLAEAGAALRGIASCSTCEVCRNVAIAVLADRESDSHG